MHAIVPFTAVVEPLGHIFGDIPQQGPFVAGMPVEEYLLRQFHVGVIALAMHLFPQKMDQSYNFV